MDIVEALIIIGAVLADLAVGDPASLPHPVRLIGRAALGLERICRMMSRGSSLWLRVSGIAAGAGLALACGGIGFGLCLVPWIGWGFVFWLCFSGLALGELLRQGRLVLSRLKAGDGEGGRTLLAGLVSRDTGGLDAAGMARSLAESLSENLNDGFVCPLFYLVLGWSLGGEEWGPAVGVGFLWAYKCVSTLDSMWGYKTDEWRDLGLGPARMDDVLAFVPARLTGLCLFAAGWFMGLASGEALRGTLRQARTMESPNAGWPMASAAWLAGGAMGGPTCYHGRVKQKPLLGPEGREWSLERIERLMRLVLAGGLASAGLFLSLSAGLGYFFRFFV